MKGTKHRYQKLLIFLLVFQMTIISSIPLFAETDKEKEVINLGEYRELVINNNKDLKDLKKSRNDYGNSLAEYDDNYWRILYGGDRSSGNKEQRKGSYYQYAYPNFVQMVNLAAQLETMDVNIQKIESTLAYNADKLYMQRFLLLDQLEIYDQMVETAKKTKDSALLKLELGTISKVDAETAQIDYENAVFNRDKVQFSIKSVEFAMQSLAGLNPDQAYDFIRPEFLEKTFDSSDFYQYFETAKASNQALNAAHSTMDALENEKKQIELYKNFVIQSDLSDFARRYEDGQYNIKATEKSIYKNLKAALSEYNKANDDVQLAMAQLKYDENMLNKLKEMERLGQIIDTQRMQYETKVLGSKLGLLSSQNDRYLLIMKLEMLVDYGIDL